ncbi:MAG TPA: hypothetical protein DD400_05815 [Rhodospirillaceae bacterium]|nr:hypothetical protein [Rhodospirillaceae bacterium]
MKKRSVLSCLVLCLALMGCSTVPEEAVEAEAPKKTVFPYIRLAPTPPPMAQKEIVPTPQNPMHEIWQKGHWSYNGKKYVWVAGRYMPRPSPTAAWSYERWEKRNYGWAFVPGHWY